MVANDTSHIVGTLDPNQIGEAIRHKKFGTDMREAIAQAFEFMQTWWSKCRQALDLAMQNQADIQQLRIDLDNKTSDLQYKIDGIYSKLSEQDERISELNQRIADLETKHEQDVQTLQNKLDERLKKLEDAVFKAIYVNDTMQDIPDTPPDSHYINDTDAIDDDNGLIINDDSYTLPYDIN